MRIHFNIDGTKNDTKMIRHSLILPKNITIWLVSKREIYGMYINTHIEKPDLARKNSGDKNKSRIILKFK